MIAALFVDARGCYADLDGVDPWPVERDARKYPGPYPVVAHPPCSRWCRLAGLVEARWGHKRGDSQECEAMIYLASPYSGDVERNVAYAHACLADSLRRGEVPVMPHLLYPQVLDDADPKQRELGIAAAMDLLRACRWLVVYQDLGISSGMRAEIDLWEARKVNQPLMPPVQYRSLGGAWNAR